MPSPSSRRGLATTPAAVAGKTHKCSASNTSSPCSTTVPNHSHRNTAARIRLAVGIWLLALTAYLCYRDIWWGLLLLAPATLHFYLAYRSHHSVQN
jgi:hypothetical protein